MIPEVRKGGVPLQRFSCIERVSLSPKTVAVSDDFGKVMTFTGSDTESPYGKDVGIQSSQTNERDDQ